MILFTGFSLAWCESQLFSPSLYPLQALLLSEFLLLCDRWTRHPDASVFLIGPAYCSTQILLEHPYNNHSTPDLLKGQHYSSILPILHLIDAVLIFTSTMFPVNDLNFVVCGIATFAATVGYACSRKLSSSP